MDKLNPQEMEDLRLWCGVIMVRIIKAKHTLASVIALSGLSAGVWDSISAYGTEGSTTSCPQWTDIVIASRFTNLELKRTTRGVTGQHMLSGNN